MLPCTPQCPPTDSLEPLPTPDTHARTHTSTNTWPSTLFFPQFPPPVVPRFLYLVPCKSFPCAAPPLSSSLPEVVNWTTERGRESVCVRERDQLDQSVSPPAVCVCAGMPKQAGRGFPLLPCCSRLVADTVCFSDNQLVSRPKLVAGALGTPTLLKKSRT